MYQETVLERMRCILMSYRCLWRNDQEKPYEWPELALDILEFMEPDAQFPANSLENFVRGLPETAKEKRAKGIRKYSKPKDDRLEGIVAFLTTPGSKGYACTKDELLTPAKPVAPLQLLEYLNIEREIPRIFDMRDLQGRFVCKSATAERQESTLQILETMDSRVAMAELVIKRGGKAVPNAYSGWAMLSAEENILLVVQHIRSQENLFYLSMGIDNAIYQSQVPRVIALLKHDLPEDTVIVDTADDEDQLVNSIIESWREQICVFRKV